MNLIRKNSFWLVSELDWAMKSPPMAMSTVMVYCCWRFSLEKVDSEFGEAIGLRKYVQMALPDRVSTIMDQQLLRQKTMNQTCLTLAALVI